MKVGDIVYSRYPRIHGEGHGVILRIKKGTSNQHLFVPSKAEVYWPVTGHKKVHRTIDLYMEVVGDIIKMDKKCH